MSYTMPSDRLFEMAGLAAELLERRGFVSVARRRDGVVTIEWWKAVNGKHIRMQRPVNDLDSTPEALAETCASAFMALASGSQNN